MANYVSKHTGAQIDAAVENVGVLEGKVTTLSEEIEALKGGNSGESGGTIDATKSGEIVTVTSAAGMTAKVVSKITGQAADGAMANVLRLRHITGKNLFDFVDAFGGAGAVIEKDGLTATLNADGTATIKGTNTKDDYNNILEFSTWPGNNDSYLRVFPAGTYTVPSGLIVNLQKTDKEWTGLGNKRNTFTVDAPFFIDKAYVTSAAGEEVDKTIPLYMVEGTSTLSKGYAYEGQTYEAQFTSGVADGAFDWQTGELKDADGNLIESVDGFEPFPMYDGANTFFVGVGESTVTYKTEGEETDNTDGQTVWGLPVLTLDGSCSAMTKDVYVNLAYTFMGMSGKVDVKKQGSSSIQTGVEIGAGFDADLGGLFNFTLKFPEAFEAKEGWGAQKKYCFKANAIDHSHARNVCSCKLWGEIVKSRADVPTELSSLVNGGAIDGFPIIVVLNGKFYALGTFNIPKDGWMFGAPKAIICADKHVDATKFKGLAVLDGSDFKLEYVEDENDADWVLPSINTAIQAVMDSDGSDLETTVGQYIDIQSAMDYYIHTVDENADDATDKNYILVTFDKVKWYFSAYDRDTAYGLHWNGKSFKTPVGGVTYAAYANTHRMMGLIYNHKKADLKARAIELRDGIKSEANVATVFTNFGAGIPDAVLAQNCERWPLLRSTSVSNTAQILNWYRLRRQIIDKEIDAMT